MNLVYWFSSRYRVFWWWLAEWWLFVDSGHKYWGNIALFRTYLSRLYTIKKRQAKGDYCYTAFLKELLNPEEPKDV